MEENQKPVGRGQIIELLKKHTAKYKKKNDSQNESYSEPVSDAVNADDSITDIARKIAYGRGSFLAKLRSKENQNLGQSLVDAASNSAPLKADESIDNITEQLSRIQAEETSPFEDRHIFKKGESGEKIKVSTNFVRLRISPDKGIFEYEISFSPNIDFINYRYKILSQHFKNRKGVRCYDGGTRLLLPEKITDNIVRYESEHPADRSPVVMCITFKKKMKAKDCAFLYNILFNNCARVLHLTRFRNKFYDSRAAHQIPQHKLEIWPGFVTVVKEYEGGIQLQCDIHHKILRTETPYDVLAGLIKRDPTNFKTLAEKELLGECVFTKYNNKFYRIDDIEWTKSPLDTFMLSTGEKIRFIDYYKKQYNIDIRDLRQPLLINRAKNEKGQKSLLICLIPELCHMTGLVDKMRKDMKVMKDIATYTRVTPAQREYAFRKFLDNIKSNPEAQEMLQEWNLTIVDDPVRLDSRILPKEGILFGKKKVCEPTDGSWLKCFRDSSVYRSVSIEYWLFIFVRKDARVAHSFTNILRKVGPGLGMDINEPKCVQLLEDRIEAYIQALRKNIEERTQIVVCVCPTSRDDRYSAIKKFCCREVPVPSQVIVTTTLNRADGMRSVVQNIALQMNNKLGGASWSIHIPFKNTMICGIDTYHRVGSKSVAAFVASISSDYTEWFSRTNIQGQKQELNEGLVQSFMAALKTYLRKNYSLPDRIVVYRDGVGDGDMEMCLEFEIPQFLEACHMVSSNYEPNFSYVVVQKRINTRFYEVLDNGRRLENPRAGGVVDHTITKKSFFDFYLISQFVRIGTATPSHYVVVYDNSDLKPDHIQRLTYKFCHLYYNWPGTIRIPAPCQYAHKLAYLVGENIKVMPSERLENTLYYL